MDRAGDRAADRPLQRHAARGVGGGAAHRHPKGGHLGDQRVGHEAAVALQLTPEEGDAEGGAAGAAGEAGIGLQGASGFLLCSNFAALAQGFGRA